MLGRHLLTGEKVSFLEMPMFELKIKFHMNFFSMIKNNMKKFINNISNLAGVFYFEIILTKIFYFIGCRQSIRKI